MTARAPTTSRAHDARAVAQVLLRMREQAGAFTGSSSAGKTEARLDDANNYKGMMNLSDYKRKREDLFEDPEEKKRKAMQSAVSAALTADRDAKLRDERDREEREAQRRERIRAQLAAGAAGSSGAGGDAAAAQDGGAAAGDSHDGSSSSSGVAAKKKKKKKASELSVLSFDDADDG